MREKFSEVLKTPPRGLPATVIYGATALLAVAVLAHSMSS
jgi:hypothetical protein